MCIGIMWNNSLVGGRASTKVWTPAPEHVMLYCTWRTSALTTELHGQESSNTMGLDLHKISIVSAVDVLD